MIRWSISWKLNPSVLARELPLTIARIDDPTMTQEEARFYALNNVCTHQFAFMSEGYVDGEYIECPMHQGRFHIPTGAAQCAPVTQPLKTYPVRTDGGDILVDLTPSD